MKTIIEYKYDEKVIRKKREEVSKELMKLSTNIKSDMIKEISASDLKILFELYDSIFFDNFFKENFKGSFKFSLSRRMTKSAGLTICSKNISKLKPEDVVLEIRIGVDFFIRYESLGRAKTVCGIDTKNSLEALQLVLEHEICHAIEFINYHKSSCKGERFKTIANNIFRHTSSYHQLPTNKEITREKYGLRVGDKVSFVFADKSLSGIIYAINKRATIMVQDKNGQYADIHGNRYVKYYVPTDLIKKYSTNLNR